MRDCINLLAAKDTLRGTAALNWSVDTPISDWDGVRVLGSPGRVTELNLSSNDLTGTIPPVLGNLSNLQNLHLGDNQLTGCVPPALRASTTTISTASDFRTAQPRSECRHDGALPVKMRKNMHTRIAMITVSLAVPLLVFVSCSDGQLAPAKVSVPAAVPSPTDAPAVESVIVPTLAPMQTSAPAPMLSSVLSNLTEEISPCSPLTGSAVDPCEPNAEQYAITSGGAGSRRDLGDEPSNMREALEFVPGFLSHIVIRGTYIPRTVRCTAGDPFRPPDHWSDEFVFTANSHAIKCYADVRVGTYVLGNGPAKLTVQIFWYTYFDGEMASVATEEGKTEQEYLEELRLLLETDDFLGGIVGREAMMFIGPATSISAQAWQVFRVWDVQRRDDDTVIAVHPDRDLWRRFRPDEYQTHLSKLEIALPTFSQAVTMAHQERVTEYDGRIGADESLPDLVTNANDLRDYYTEVGAYDTGVPAPAQPPPPCGLAVPNQANNPGLIRDCINLLAAKDTLRGTATLNWSVDTPITDWDGVRVQGSPSRVTELNLSSNGLTGTIPPDLGRLDGLVFLRLVNNQLTGCIPPALRGVDNNDLDSLGLQDCQEAATPPTTDTKSQ